MSSTTVRRLRNATPVERWSLANAGVVLGATGWALGTQSTGLLVVPGAGMLVALAVLARTRWTPDGGFGGANAVTALRLAVLCTLPFLPADTSPWTFVGVGLAVLVADGVDGWLARRYGLSSEFGEFFDKETDAFFLLVLCVLTVERGALPLWITSAGLLRYVFVLALFALQPSASKEYRASWARVIYVGVVLALLTAFLPYPTLYKPLVYVAFAALVGSFGRYFWWILRLRRGNDGRG